jgi:hypothetical protein
MGSTFFKNIIREIKNSFGRFLAIFAIVAIGVFCRNNSSFIRYATFF